MTETLLPHDFTPLDVGQLEERLYANNVGITGHADGRGLGFVAVDAAGARVGAIAGYSWAGMSEIRQLFVDAAARGNGVGRRLVEAFVAEAVARGCGSVCVMSHSFQAPGLYEKCGFTRIAELSDWPPGHSQVVLRKLLSPLLAGDARRHVEGGHHPMGDADGERTDADRPRDRG